MATESGMAEHPGQSHSLASRLVCAKCGIEPEIVNPAGIKMAAQIQITVRCHGETDTKTIEKSRLLFTQRFFEAKA